jgi:DNA-directed RNA polymerase subunit beta
VLLRALGYSTQELLNYFYSTETVYIEKGGKFSKSIEYDLLGGQRATRDIKIGSETVVKRNTKFTRAAIKRLKDANLDRLPMELPDLIGKVSAEDVVDKETGEVLLECNEEVTEVTLERLREAGVTELRVLFIDGLNVGPYLRDTLIADKVKTMEDAIMEIYRRLRPGDPPTLETAKQLFHNLFFNPERYDLSAVGRLKLN